MLLIGFSDGIALQKHLIGVDRVGDILDLPLTKILENKSRCAPHMFMDVARDTDAAGFSESFHPCSDVDAPSIQIIALDNHVAEVDTDSKFDALVLGQTRVAIGQLTLYRHGTIKCLDGARKLSESAVASDLKDSPAEAFGRRHE